MMKNSIFLILIIISSIVVYYNSISVPFLMDDINKIVQNPDIKDMKNILKKLVYPYDKENYVYDRNDPSRPLTYLSYAINYYSGKLNPKGYHIVNILLHMFNSLLVFYIVDKFFIISGLSGTLIPFTVTLIFTIHPLFVSTVTYIYGRSDLLMSFFFLLAVLFFIKAKKENNKIGSYILSFLSFVFSLLSKQSAVILPFLILFLDLFLIPENKKVKKYKKIAYYAGMFLVIVVYLLFKSVYLGGIGDVEAGSALWDRSSYIAIQPYAFIKYVQLFFIPSGLCIDHFIKPDKLTETKIIVSYIIFTIFIIISFLTLRMQNKIRKIAFTGFIWFIVTLLPTSSVMPTTTPVVESRVYLAGIGLLLMFFSLYYSFIERISGRYPVNRSKYIVMSLIVFFIIVIYFGRLTVKRNELFSNPVSLWQDVIKKYPDNYLAYNRLADEYQAKGDYTGAIINYTQSIKIKPDHFIPYFKLGYLYDILMEYDMAIANYKKAIELNPDYILAYVMLGGVYNAKKDYDNAIKVYEEALVRKSDLAVIHNLMGITYKNSKKYKLAEQSFEKAIEINPDYTDAYMNLMMLYYDINQPKKADALQERMKKK